MTTHVLKCYPTYFDAVQSGRKTFEVRDNGDRGFQSGDVVELREFSPRSQAFTDAKPLAFEIGYVYPLEGGKVAFSLLPVSDIRFRVGPLVEVPEGHRADLLPAAITHTCGDCGHTCDNIMCGHDCTFPVMGWGPVASSAISDDPPGFHEAVVRFRALDAAAQVEEWNGRHDPPGFHEAMVRFRALDAAAQVEEWNGRHKPGAAIRVYPTDECTPGTERVSITSGDAAIVEGSVPLSAYIPVSGFAESVPLRRIEGLPMPDPMSSKGWHD